MKNTTICIAIGLFLFMEGCCFPPFHEPYPAMDHIEISVEETPKSILEKFEKTYPNAIITKIEQEYFKRYLRGYIIHFELHDKTDFVFITHDGKIVE